MNIEKLKRIMFEKKTRLQSLRNQERKQSWQKPKKINELLIHILKKNIRELNEIIYAEAK